MRIKSFSTFYKLSFRLLSPIAVILLLKGILNQISDINSIDYGFHEKVISCFVLVLDTVTALCFILLFFNPEKLPLFSLVSFAYGASNLIAPGNNGEIGIGFSMLLLGFSALWVRGFFKKKKAIKIFCSVFFLILIVLLNLFFNTDTFERVLRYILGYSLIFSVILLMLSNFFLESKYSTLSGRKILDLRDQISNGLLKERDIKWLKQILDGEKYSAIARESAVSDGTMRNRIREVFKIIGTSDKKQFIAIYSDALIISSQEEFQAWKDTLV